MGTFTTRSLHSGGGKSDFYRLQTYADYIFDPKKIYPSDLAAASIVDPDWPRILSFHGATSDKVASLQMMVASNDLYEQLHPVSEQRMTHRDLREFLLDEQYDFNIWRQRRWLPPMDYSDYSDRGLEAAFHWMQQDGHIDSRAYLQEGKVCLPYRSILAERCIFSLAPGECLPYHELVDIAREIADHERLKNHLITAVWHLNTGNMHLHMMICNTSYDGKSKLSMDAKLRRELRRHCDRISARHGLSIINDRDLLKTDGQIGVEHARFVKKCRENGIVVHSNRDITARKGRLTYAAWKRERAQFQRDLIPRTERFYCGPVEINRAAHPEIPYAIPALDDNMNRLPENLLFLQWILTVMRSEMGFLRVHDMQAYRRLYKTFSNCYENAQEVCSILEQFNIRTSADLNLCVKQLGKILDSECALPDREDTEVVYRYLEMFRDLQNDPMILVEDILNEVDHVRDSGNPESRLDSMIHEVEEVKKTEKSTDNTTKSRDFEITM